MRPDDRRRREDGPPPDGERRRGRPCLYDEAAVVSIRVRMTVSQKLDLEQVARDNQMDLTAVIREAVNTFVSDYREAQVFRGPKTAA